MIEINNITKIYNKKTPNETLALDNVSFSVEKGDIVSIVGKTGSGKTTISHILLGLVKPTSGQALINNDILITKKSRKKSLRKITKILLSSFQYPNHQLFKPTVKEEILLNSDDENEMYKLLNEFNLDEAILSKSPYKLSSGQKRKVILISLLIQKPEVIIFDEATSFLDPASRREFVKTVKYVNNKYNTTILFISHNIEDVKQISNKVLFIDEGKVVKYGSPDETLKLYIKEVENG